MPNVALVMLRSLAPGSTFRLPYTGRVGVLNMANDCRANVTYRAEKTTKTFKVKKRNRKTGLEEERDITVPDRSGTLDITPNALVELVNGGSLDELEDLL